VVVAVNQNFDVYKTFGNSREDKAQLEELESRHFDVGDKLLPSGLRRVSKSYSSVDAALADLEKTFGSGEQYEIVGSGDAMTKILDYYARKPPDHPDAKTVLIHPTPQAPASSPDDTTEPGAGTTNNSKTQATEAPTPETSDGIAQVIHEGALLLHSPPHLWDYIDREERKQLALRVGTDMFRERASYARAVAWSIAPESELLRRAAANSPLAKRMLEVRAGLTEQDAALRRLNVEARKEEIALQRVLIATLGDLRAQVRKWTWLAGWAPAFLIVTLLFAMAMTAWLIDIAAPNLDGWAVAPAIFVLALFAVSPAVLLLRERPLEGIDKWMPSAGSGGAGTSSTGSDDSVSSSDEATETTTSRGGLRIGGHKGERPN
jgi:hypothetical protein